MIKMKIADETIIKFRNGEELHMPSDMYDELDFKRKGGMECSWTKKGFDYKVQFYWEDVLSIAKITRSTSSKDN